MKTYELVVGNLDRCGRCRAKHGGNNHLCPVHGTVSKGCCAPPCNPAEWGGYSLATGWQMGQSPFRLPAIQPPAPVRPGRMRRSNVERPDDDKHRPCNCGTYPHKSTCIRWTVR